MELLTKKIMQEAANSAIGQRRDHVIYKVGKKLVFRPDWQYKGDGKNIVANVIVSPGKVVVKDINGKELHTVSTTKAKKDEKANTSVKEAPKSSTVQADNKSTEDKSK